MPRFQDAQTDRAGLAGFTLIEMMIAMAILLSVSAIVLTFMFQMAMSQATISNRTEMHSSVRSATEVMQQEISQAGRIAVPGGSTTLNGAVTGSAIAQPVNVSSSSGMFQNELLVIGSEGSAGTCPGATCAEETVQITNAPASTNQITAIFKSSHGDGAMVRPAGAGITGILTTANGNTLKMFGDINDDGNMVYVQYDCNPTAAGDGTLTRRQMPWDTPLANIGNYRAQLLLSNLKTNPVDAISGLPVPCFTFQTKSAGWTALDGVTAETATPVVNVAITMTARTQLKDAQTGVYQYETKALLTVSPRNAFESWEMSTMPSAPQHVQMTPAEITNLAGAM
jgi:prepilin-type N-terminal cleavage/methylation domain-containing protein